jgi:aryl-alcohol dehydrogenase-like predicted oxidoreductase
MEKRRLGKTRHMSTILTFGAAAFWLVTQAEAEIGIEMAVEHGINHIDVAPQYGQAEMRLGPWLAKHRREVFLACKTMQRTKQEIRESIEQSLKTLRVDDFDLFQLHGVDDMETLQGLLAPKGGMEAILEGAYFGEIGHLFGLKTAGCPGKSATPI